jgi:putative ABC transport system permease protein
MNALFLDVRYGLRMLRRSPGFTFVAVLSLALGIGANTAIFSLVNAVLLRPLPFPVPDRLVMVWEDATFAGFPRNTPAPANYVDWKRQNQVFDGMAALSWNQFTLVRDGEPEKVTAYSVTADFFPLLGVEPALGRNFFPEEDTEGANRVVILSYQTWQQRFGGQQNIIGSEILLNDEKYTVVGVMPSGFQFLEKYIACWVPMALTAEEAANRGAHYLTVIARMKPGVSLEQANDDLQTIQQGIARDYPNEAENLGAFAISLREQLAGDLSRPLIILLVAVGFVLLIACANIANLLLARAANRAKEIAVRTALGGGRMRIVRQLMTESVLLAGAGGAVGLLFAVWSFAFLQQLVPPQMSLSTTLAIDLPILGYALVVSLITGVIFGLAPAVQASRIDLNEVLKQGGRATGAHTGRNLLRSVMVVAEVALALVLLVGAGLLIQTFYKLQNQYSGLRPENVLTLRTGLARNRYNEHYKRVAFYDQVLERVRSLPGVVSAGYTTSVPLEWKGGTSGFVPEGLQALPGLSYDANHRNVSADYLQTLGIPLLEGRYFDSRDNARSQAVAIVNETMARQYWPEQSALGKRFKIGDPDSERPWLSVVGVVGDVRQMGIDVPVKAEMYLPYQQVPYYAWFAPRDLVIRSSGDPMNLVAAVRSEVRAVDPLQPISNIRTMEQILGEETAPRRLSMTLLATFAGLALLLAAIGIYGVLSYFVVQYTPEIGIRLALGAQTGHVLGLVLRRGMILVVLGVGIGLIASLVLTRWMTSLLYGVSASDPATFASIALMLTAVALLACYIPARRATKVDPLVALRCE